MCSSLAMNFSVDHISTRPHVWVVDGAVSERFLDFVDNQLASSEGTVTSELRNGKSITSRSVEFGVDDVSRQLFETVAGFWGLPPEQSIESFVVSDICGEGQTPHVDHINLDDLPGYKLDFLDLTRQSTSPINPRRVVPTISVVVYFNSVGGLQFPHSADELGTIAAKRGRIVMFQNYVDTDRPYHDSMAAHCGIYLDSLPKRILVMGILANDTPSFSPGRPESICPKPGLIYCPGTAQDPLRHDAPSYDYMRTRDEMIEIEAAREREAAAKMKPPTPPRAKRKDDFIVFLEIKMAKPKEAIVSIMCRSLAGTDLCSLEAGADSNVGALRRQVERKLDPEDKTNVVLCIRTETFGKAQDDVKLSELLPVSIDEVKMAFAKADSNKDGFLDKAEAKAMLKQLADAIPSIMSNDEIEQLFDAVDTDADGRLNLPEFIDWCFGVQMIGESEKNSLKEDLKRA
ncbi:unnamed protein product [Symbiodinium sp. CCMP2592]|nr:unnamed protein product [Symbiodinium sp. CCMP2592]